ncbi:uncharacterized protein EI90DRAFT_3055934 [Cantharellus anzutake]|uniref:uncharacterized protein n=1 Tax=Cantharellus anzutake TaxID=1750568 RepID=UPI0019072CDF|nr:uncharacterized protein EI90DRAFT_3055934 [Cantharellus anzutake]KAF8331934.1 hypothetical protein EI90DRAFT_3055934 [Cantharellus anzutake]
MPCTRLMFGFLYSVTACMGRGVPTITVVARREGPRESPGEGRKKERKTKQKAERNFSESEYDMSDIRGLNILPWCPGYIFA